MFVVVVCIVISIFFFKQKTAYEMRISDWSSDVCSSDLLAAGLKSHVQSLSRFAGEGLICGDLRDRRVDPLQCLLAAGKVNRVRDVRADLGAGDRDAQR